MCPAGFDPYHRLVAAIALQAALDVVRPPKSLSYLDRWTAQQFVNANQRLYIGLGISQDKLAALAGGE